MAIVTGWSRGTWGEGAWSEEAPVVSTGVSATSSLGSVSVTASCLVVEDGVSSLVAHGQVTTQLLQIVIPTSATGTGQVAAPSISGDANFSITGVAGTGAIGNADAVSVAEVTGVSATGGTGTITMTGTANVVPTGVEDTGEIGTPFIFLEQKITAPSFLATGGVGSPTLLGDANFSITGVQGLAVPTTPAALGNADVPVTNTSILGTTALGSVTVAAGAIPRPSGVTTTAFLNSPDISISVSFTATGVSGTGAAGEVIVWGRIVPNVNQTWSEVAA